MKDLSEMGDNATVPPRSGSPLPADTVKKSKSPKVSSTFGLAQYLGLSEWTVSRAINGHPEVKAATRERIFKAMDEVGFRPNPVARGLNGKSMGLVGVCFGNTYNAIMIDKISLLDQFLREHQLRGILAISPKNDASDLRILADFRYLRVDGVVLIAPYLQRKQITEALDGIPCVVVDPSDQNMSPSVSLDRRDAIRLEIDHLFELGHRSFGTLGFSSSDQWRWEGIVNALGARGLSPEKNLQVFELENKGMESYAEGIELAKLALACKKPPTAFLALNDQVAAGAMQQIQDSGFKVPDDFSVAGFDNLPLGRYLHPTITTIDQQPHLLISQAGELLLEALGRKPKSGDSVGAKVEPILIVRESTGPAPRRSKRSGK